jgi:hypothetical protein
MTIAKGKSATHSFLKIATPLLTVSCTSVMVHTPQQMSDYAINLVKVDPKTDLTRWRARTKPASNTPSVLTKQR